jgi:hypothetical protein
MLGRPGYPTERRDAMQVETPRPDEAEEGNGTPEEGDGEENGGQEGGGDEGEESA